MLNKKNLFFLNSLQGKIFAAIILACISILLSYKVANVAFNDMQSTVAKIAPNQKLVTVNGLFVNILQLDNLQKEMALKKEADEDDQVNEKLRDIKIALDTLRILSRNDQLQIQRIDSMENILAFRDSLFKNYIKIRSDLNSNSTLFNQIHSLYHLISVKSKRKSGIKTTETKVTKTTKVVPKENEEKPEVEPKQNKRGFFDRLFGGSKKDEKDEDEDVVTTVDEELSVTVDTIQVAQSDHLVKEVEGLVKKIEQEQKSRTNELLNKEVELINYSNILLTNILELLNEIEQKEIQQVNVDNEYISEVVNTSLDRINFIMYLFFLLIAVLAMFILFDITKTQKHRNQLLLAKEEAEHHSQVKQRFLSNISHELRTPLQSILGYSEQVQQQEKPDRGQLEAIHKSADHLLHIVNEVLDYSRIISGKFSFNNEPFNIKKVIDETFETIKFQAEAKNLQLQLNANFIDHQWYLGDGFRLKQVLFNLLGNAIKFTNEGEVGLTISAIDISEAEETSFLFEVWDTGIGISEENLQKIFNDFEQEDKTIASNFGGTGLGLNIVKSLVEAQGGIIQVESEKGLGSRFKFNLILEKAEAIFEEAPSNEIFQELNLCNKILVVDDDPFILQLCQSILDKHKIPNHCCNSPLSILQEEWDKDINLVFTDIRMPEMSGFDFCQRVKSLSPENCKVIALTAQALPEEREAILNKGFDAVLMKPFKEKDLLNQILLNLEDEPVSIEEASGFDLSTISRMLKGNEEALIDILNQYLVETQTDLENLKSHIEEQDSKLVLGMLHRLAGRIGQIGDTILSSQLRNIEVSLVNDLPLSDFIEEIYVLMEEIGKLNNNIKKEVEVRVKTS